MRKKNVTEQPGTLQEEDAGESKVSGPRSLTRLLEVFYALGAASDGLSLAELSVRLGSPKSSLLNLLRPLVAESYLIHGAGQYRLGPAMFRLASVVLDSWPVRRIVHPYMQQLAESTGESVMLSVLDATRGLMAYVHIVQGPHPVRYQITAGSIGHLYNSAAGRVLIAFADPTWGAHYLSTVRPESRSDAAITRLSLKRDVEAIRERSIAVEVDTYTSGLSAIAAPLFDSENHCAACLDLAGPSDRIRPNLKELQDKVLACSQQASRALSAAMTAQPLGSASHCAVI